MCEPARRQAGMRMANSSFSQILKKGNLNSDR